MADESWQKVREIFDLALRLRPEERRGFVKETCAADKTLFVEVESLLSSLDNAESFMETPAVAQVADVIEVETTKLERGTRLGHYEIIEQIGEGGMGEVYLAKDTRLNRKVALKLLAAHITEDKNRVSRFRQEAFATSALNHPNIVTIYEIGSWQNRDFIATEFIDGMTLRSLLQKRKLLIDEILNIALQTASALAAAHGVGIVHRDIKPENIMIRPDGLVKVLDFGIAKYRPTETGRKALVETEVGEVIGTAAYMSPEQARGLDIDSQTDIWSLGVILYEMIARKLPFLGKTKSDRIAAILEHEPVALTKIGRTVPPQLQQIVNRALAKDKKERYAEVAEMAEDLHLLREMTGGKSSSRFILPVRKSVTSRRAYLFAVFAVIVLFVGAIALSYYFYTAKSRTVAEKKSIAVLPLKPINTANRDELYEIGVADSLIHWLGSMRAFVVRPLSATRKYADIEQDPIAAGKEQQVDYVLASNYQMAGGKIRITSQLFNVATGQIEETYKSEKETSNIFAMQDAIASEVGNILLARFAATSSSPTIRRGTTNEDAYRLYLQGMYFYDNKYKAGALKSIEAFEQALRIDPNYARAWAGLAHAHRVVGNSDRVANTHQEYQKSIEAIDKALALDENLSEAQSAACENKMYYEYDFTGAELSCLRAIELDPNSALAHQIYSRYLISRGRFDEAIDEIKTAIDLEPTSLFNHHMYGVSLHYARRYPEAVAQFKQVLAMDEGFSIADYWLYITLAAQGDELEAFERFMSRLAFGKADEATIQAYQAAYQTFGWPGVMRKRFENTNEAYFLGAAYNAQAGNKDQAFEYLEKSYQRREMWMAYLQVEPRLDPLRDDPRYDELVRRVESK